MNVDDYANRDGQRAHTDVWLGDGNVGTVRVAEVGTKRRVMK